MKLSTKKMLTLIGEQYARIIELNECLDKADAAFNLNIRPENVKRNERKGS